MGLEGVLGGSLGSLGWSCGVLVAPGAFSGIFREIPGPLFPPFLVLFCLFFRPLFWLGFLIVFRGLWKLFGGHFAPLFEVFLGTLAASAKKAAPHESAVNSIQIEGRAQRKATRKPSKNDEKTV